MKPDPTASSLRSASITRLLSLMRCACGGYRFDDVRFTPTCTCPTWTTSHLNPKNETK